MVHCFVFEMDVLNDKKCSPKANPFTSGQQFMLIFIGYQGLIASLPSTVVNLVSYMQRNVTGNKYRVIWCELSNKNGM